MKGAVLAKFYRRVIAATTKDLWTSTPEAALSIALRLFFPRFSIQHQHPTENHSFGHKLQHNSDDIHAFPRQTTYHALDICIQIVYM